MLPHFQMPGEKGHPFIFLVCLHTVASDHYSVKGGCLLAPVSGHIQLHAVRAGPHCMRTSACQHALLPFLQGLLLSSLNLAAKCSQEPKLATLSASCIEHACEGAVTASMDIPKNVIFGLVQAIQAQSSDTEVCIHAHTHLSSNHTSRGAETGPFASPRCCDWFRRGTDVVLCVRASLGQS